MEKVKNIAAFIAILFLLTITVKNAESCLCAVRHPQTHYCHSDFVAIVRVKERLKVSFDEVVYRVKVRDILKLANDDDYAALSEPGSNGYMKLYTPSFESLCGVDLNVNETYVIGGQIHNKKATILLCGLKIRWPETTKRQRRGFKNLYARGCMCEVRLTTFKKKSQLLEKANGKVCPWESYPGPFDCQEQHGLCVPQYGSCFWKPSRPYVDCIRAHKSQRS